MAKNPVFGYDEEEQTYWFVCEYCEEGYYSPIEILHPVCNRCWQAAHE